MNTLVAGALVAMFFAAVPVRADSRPYWVYIGMNSGKDIATMFCENRGVIVYVARNGTLSLNGTAVSHDKIEQILSSVFVSRRPRLLYVKADPQVSFGAVLKLVEVASRHAEYIVLLTPFVERQFHCPSVP